MMSRPSVNKHLEAQGATLETASEARMASAFLAASGKTRCTGQRAMVTLNPNSDEGKQFSR
jgi:hypothetical protein